ncbi:MAG: hypothetical protein A2107_06180 [Verrucomicrobia bacterium GWF2_62_7]|nr:MAG: hypothetical protein A2107_06180 [Verrucomicrobia bacterium GWF2_62_7]
MFICGCISGQAAAGGNGDKGAVLADSVALGDFLRRRLAVNDDVLLQGVGAHGNNLLVFWQVSHAIAGSSANSNAVQELPGDADQAAIIAKINELIGALRR